MKSELLTQLVCRAAMGSPLIVIGVIQPFNGGCTFCIRLETRELHQSTPCAITDRVDVYLGIGTWGFHLGRGNQRCLDRVTIILISDPPIRYFQLDFPLLT